MFELSPLRRVVPNDTIAVEVDGVETTTFTPRFDRTTQQTHTHTRTHTHTHTQRVSDTTQKRDRDMTHRAHAQAH